MEERAMRLLPSVLALTCCSASGSWLLADGVDPTTATIRSRLASARYCATQRADGTLDVILHVYTAEQHQVYAESKNKYRDEREARAEARELLRKRMQEIQDSARTSDEQQAQLRELLSDQGSTLPRWLLRSTLCRVVSVGQDFIEVEEIDDPDGTTLIPFSKLGKVVFLKSIEADESGQ
jgi:hypothetical protein